MASIPINRDLAVAKETDIGRWSNVEALETAWDGRAAVAAQFIASGSRVLDLGCGRMTLKSLLPEGCSYRGCDIVARDSDTVVCNFNNGEFPSAQSAEADVITMLGVLEYIVDLDAFFERLKASGRELLLSYCMADFSDGLDRPSLGWMNHLTLTDLAELLDRFGYSIVRSDRIDQLQLLIKARPSAGVMPLAPCSVAVVSFRDVGNFGDRLGSHVINALLPPQADVHHVTFKTLGQARDSYDLVVLGIGNSMFKPLLVEPVLDVVARGKAAVGIFGTQFRSEIPRPMLDRLIDRLDHWYARYEDDVLLYGRGRSNVSHMGDWLITQFPMAHGVRDEMLTIGDEIWQELPLDRTIERIQNYKNVYSTRLHPLLCALTSAELVSYQEQRVGEVVSGKFASMLVDVFGRTFEEKKFFPVDRNAVIQYKAKVDRNVTQARDDIRSILSNVAAAV